MCSKVRLSSCFFLLLISLCLLGTNVRAQTQPLMPGDKLERGMKGGEIHLYRVALTAGDFIHISVSQKGIDVILAVSDVSGNKISEVDSPNGKAGSEKAWALASVSGEYTVEVRSRDAKALEAQYEILFVERRPSVPDDAFFVKGMDHIGKGTSLLFGVNKNKDTGIENLKTAEAAIGKIVNKERKGWALRRLADAYDIARVASEALRLYDLAIPLLEESGSKKEAAAAYFYSARIAPDILDRVARSARSTALAREANDEDREANSLIDSGNWESLYLGEFQAALEKYRAALAISRRQNNPTRIAAILGNIGNTYRRLGDYPSSLDAQLEAMKVTGSQNRSPRPLSLMSLGTLYGEMGNYALSREYNEQALSGFLKAGDGDPVPVALSNLGHTYVDEGEFKKGLEYFERALKIMDERKRYDPGIHCYLARAQKGLGNIEQAREKALQCLTVHRDARMRFHEAQTLLLLGEIELLARRADKSLESAENAAGIAAKHGYAGLEYSAFALKAQSLSHLAKTKEAKDAARAAIEMVEAFRSNVIDERGRQSYFSTMDVPFHILIENEIHSGNFREAWSVAERMKARHLLDLISQRPGDINKGLSGTEREIEAKLRRQLTAINRQLSNELAKELQDKQVVAELRNRLTRSRFEIEEFGAKLYAAHPELRVQRAEMKRLQLSTISPQLLTPARVVLEFVVAAEKTFLITIVASNITADIEIKAYEVGASRQHLAAAVAAYREKLASGDLSFGKEGREMYDLLLKPAEDELKGKTDVVIVPDGPLWELPFQALIDSRGKHLVEKSAVSYVPSLTALAEMLARSRQRQSRRDAAELLAIGNPMVGPETKRRVERVFMSEPLQPLPEAERLVKELGKLYGESRSKIFFGVEAREQVAKSEAPRYRVLQFATHGILNNASPMYSHLVMAQDANNPNEDGLLEAWELKDLDLKADMIILSACDTARGKISGGEGVIGMTWAAFIAGAPTTVASQWKVESSSTTEFMLEFHRQMLANKKISKAEALRRASLKLMRSPKYRHPSYWAPWILVGDGS